ncbi:hypothetical protein IFM89_039877 [Coptis chinensis]|uniref:Uncharacterized protein n=1 Tax=Coptis chinensis TaxID=261450 RepID=A0A835LA89_9MAGN|nr:hypothetical protein IFM89_039877 [Coptis chinensis]
MGLPSGSQTPIDVEHSTNGLRQRTPVDMDDSVANGDKTVCRAICNKLKWEMQGHMFEDNIRLLPLGGCDMVLGRD